jgi:hypothetical protein
MRNQPKHAVRRARPRLVHQVVPAATKMTRKAAPALSKAAQASRRTGPVVPRLARAGLKAALRLPKIALAWLLVHATRYWRRLSLEAKRAHVMVGVSVGFAAVVLVTSFPLTGLLSQGTALSRAAHGLSTVEAQNRSLSAQAADLSDPATGDNLARQDYGLVPRGQRAYDVLPPAAASQASRSPGQVPLDEAPVAPGSGPSEALVGVVPPATAARRGGGHGAKQGAASDSEPRGYWARVVKTLEFWS